MTDPLPNRTESLPDERQYNPSQDDSWADILRAVLQEISVNSLVSGTDRTVYDPEEGQLFVPTDGGAWYLGDGTSWIEISPESLTDGGTINGDLTLDAGTTTRFFYDTDLSGDPLYFQRDTAAAETAMTFDGSNVGIGSTTASTQLEVGGDITASGNVHVGNILTFTALASDPSSPPNGSMWFVE